MFWFLLVIVLIGICGMYIYTSQENFTDDQISLAQKILDFLKSGPHNFAVYSQFINANGNTSENLGRLATYKSFASNNNLSINDILTVM